MCGIFGVISGNNSSLQHTAFQQSIRHRGPDGTGVYHDGDVLLVLSESGEIYRVNGVCQCKAFANGQPCWHRAAARLIERYNETSH